MVARVKKSVWNSADNIVVDNYAALKALHPEEREGIIFVSGAIIANDGGGGMFIYKPAVARSLNNNGTIIDPTDEGTGSGCWVRIYTDSTGSLSWFGSDDRNVGNLLSDYGVEGLTVVIDDGERGGRFRFTQSEVGNSDGINNFNGWVRQNDPNFTDNLKLNDKKITQAARAQANTDVPNLEQVIELAQSGDYVGIVPLYSPRYIGDGATVIYETEATDNDPDVDLLSAAAFEVSVNGLKMRPITDYTINVSTGNLEFAFPPQNGALIDICWFAPFTLSDFGDIVVQATISGEAHTLAEWFGEYGSNILVKTTGTADFIKLGDRLEKASLIYEHKADAIANPGLARLGTIITTKGDIVAGDGGFRSYFLITKSLADAEEIPYDQLGTFNFLIPSNNWVAVYQDVTLDVVNFTFNEYLAAGQTEIILTDEVISGSVYISGSNVDNGRLVEGVNYTISSDNLTITFLESYPENTLVTVVYAESVQNEEEPDPGIPDAPSDGSIYVRKDGNWQKLNKVPGLLVDVVNLNNQSVLDLPNTNYVSGTYFTNNVPYAVNVDASSNLQKGWNISFVAETNITLNLDSNDALLNSSNIINQGGVKSLLYTGDGKFVIVGEEF